MGRDLSYFGIVLGCWGRVGRVGIGNGVAREWMRYSLVCLGRLTCWGEAKITLGKDLGAEGG